MPIVTQIVLCSLRPRLFIASEEVVNVHEQVLPS